MSFQMLRFSDAEIQKLNSFLCLKL